jgi:hypothetical protein
MPNKVRRLLNFSIIIRRIEQSQYISKGDSEEFLSKVSTKRAKRGIVWNFHVKNQVFCWGIGHSTYGSVVNNVTD